MNVGTPARGPSGVAARAASNVAVTMAPSFEAASARSIAASMTSRRDTSPFRLRATVSTASQPDVDSDNDMGKSVGALEADVHGAGHSTHLRSDTGRGHRIMGM